MMGATAAVSAGSGRELANPPTDGVSNLRFSNHSDNLLVSSWDRRVRLYDASANLLKGQFLHGGPVLDCCFHDDASGFSGSADHTVRRYDFSTGKEDILGRHEAPVRCVEYSYAAVINIALWEFLLATQDTPSKFITMWKEFTLLKKGSDQNVEGSGSHLMQPWKNDLLHQAIEGTHLQAHSDSSTLNN